MDVLITGGGGFLGSRLAARLQREGWRVHLLDLRFDPIALQDAGPVASVIEADVTNGPRLIETITALRPAGIIHLAAILSSACELDPARGFAVNVAGTVYALEGARRAGVTRFVTASSAAAYDAPEPTGHDQLDEDDPLVPFGVYAMTKSQVETWCAFYQRRFGLDTRVVRPGAVIGPGRVAGGAASGFTNAIIEEPFRGRPYVCPVAPDDAAPVVHRSDIIEGLALLYLAEAPPSRVYNMSPCHVSAGELARLVRTRVPTAQITYAPDPVVQFVVGRWRYANLDSSRATRELGWVPRYPTAERIVAACWDEIHGQTPA